MSNKTAIRPLGDRVLVQPKEEKEVTRGGIIIPDTAKEKPMEGTVIAVGIKRDKDGKEVPFDVKPGDTVLLPKKREAWKFGGLEAWRARRATNRPRPTTTKRPRPTPEARRFTSLKGFHHVC